MGHWAQGRMGAHQAKKLEDDALVYLRSIRAFEIARSSIRAR